MPVQPTYPGVYIEELPSGVRTIMGVSTSVTAFVGKALRGPVNKAIHIFSPSDYERRFGGLSADSKMSYAVNQFFQNGGSEAWVVRLAKNPAAATLDIKDSSGKNLFTIHALDEGTAGNDIQVLIVPNAQFSNAFDITFTYISTDNPSDSIVETYKNVSLETNSSRYIGDLINGDSQLVTITEEPVAKVPATPGGTGGTGDTVSNTGDTGGTGSTTGGTGSTTAVATTTPRVPAPLRPTAGTLTSSAFGDKDLDKLPDTDHTSFMISLDGDADFLVTMDSSAANGSDLGAKLADIAGRIQSAVRSYKPALDAYRNFTCTADATNKQLILASGTTNAKSSVAVKGAIPKSIAKELHLLDGVLKTGTDPAVLKDGKSEPFTDFEAYNIYIGDLLQREGIYALEEVDLFNLLCLPGVTDAGILAAAMTYCQQRRAFLMVDAPQGYQPQQMVDFITGPNLPKGDLGTYAALYYPWVKAPDPLNNGKLTSFPPSGMIAGLYARIDSTRGVWKAPAGTEANLVGVRAADYLLTDMENGSLNQHGVNCLRIFPVYGAVCWGSRTVSGDDQIASDYKYVPIRRLTLYIEESLYRGMKWAVFEPNDEPLWAQLRLNVGAFMHDLFRQGAFQGQTPSEAYLVKCDKETTTQNDINRGVVNILVAFAPLKPAEFVVLQIQQMTGQIQV